MKKIQKVLSVVFALAIFLGAKNCSHAFSAKLENKVNLGKNSFLTDMAVYKGKLYYTDAIISGQEKDENGNLYGGNCDVKVYEKDIKTGKKTLINSYGSYNLIGLQISFKVLNDGNLYMMYHIGGGVMGSDFVFGLTGVNKGKNILTYNYGNMEFDNDGKSVIITPTGPWDNGNVIRNMTGKIYSLAKEGEFSGKYFIEGMTGKNAAIRYASKYSALRGNTLYLKKISGVEDKLNQYDLTALDLDTGAESKLAECISTIGMGENEIYFIRDLPMVNELVQPKKMLYKYDFESQKTTLISQENNPYYEILPIGDKVFFTGSDGFYTDDAKLNLFMANSDGSETKKLCSNFKRVVSDGEKLAVLYSDGKGSNIQFLDACGKVLGKISLPQTQVDMFMAGDEFIAWSWQSGYAYYYKIDK